MTNILLQNRNFFGLIVKGSIGLHDSFKAHCFRWQESTANFLGTQRVGIYIEQDSSLRLAHESSREVDFVSDAYIVPAHGGPYAAAVDETCGDADGATMIQTSDSSSD